MEMHQVKYFLALCRERTFTRAAKRCDVSQPSLTNAIKKLEKELGGELFHRGPKKTDLTMLGCAIRPHLRRLNQCLERAHQEAARHLKRSAIANGRTTEAFMRKLPHLAVAVARNSGGNAVSRIVHAHDRGSSFGIAGDHLG
jgi:DNA-binding transcriptional LysR family regulator